MIKSWQNLYQSNQKFRNNYSLFKEKYKNDKTFKEANKYFEIEKLFKGETENKQLGAISRNYYLNKVTKKNLIENFIELMRTEGVRRSSLFTDVESHKVLMDFSGLQKEDKRKIFEEFKDSL